MIWPPKSKKDLLHFQIECAGQRFEWTPTEGKNFTLKPIFDFDAENFQKTARNHTKMYIAIPNFYPDLKKFWKIQLN